ncbi:response regulator [candidate division KSB1 bacterium]|nr:response regulator [candidate division KSB1 bacterium]
MTQKVLIVDDHPLVRQQLRKIVENISDVKVIGEAENGRIAVFLSKKMKPDIVIMDISMPVMNGVEATREIMNQTPVMKVIATSMHYQKVIVDSILSYGAAGFVLKESLTSELARAIETVNNNNVYMSSSIERQATYVSQ